ncbi:DUF3144 domain-containing protein [Limibaculum sp. M0105]|uniref:DUF3144 domain-containing protein n=1 Tax=Thermohalobaculum xanthum TaxID=2753746 RepID=A0A8J7M928_9RHOB|nr:DUF3144 domain-containing protein [Thermohalobaculum xanthum]MBK0400035.1 DUF3144 domain-containing protein [Thermohalobaculum xanthum]
MADDHEHGPDCGHPHDAAGDVDRAFFDMADQFIAVANRLTDEVPSSRISAAMMYATARFNAFLAQTQGVDAGEIDERTVLYFRDQYERMLRENMGQTLVAKKD